MAGKSGRVYSFCEYGAVEFQRRGDGSRNGGFLPRKSEHPVSRASQFECDSAELCEPVLHGRMESHSAAHAQLRATMGALPAAECNEWPNFCFRYGSFSQGRQEHNVSE